MYFVGGGGSLHVTYIIITLYTIMDKKYMGHNNILLLLSIIKYTIDHI